MNPLTLEIPKALVYVAGKTLLEWSLERLFLSGCNDIIVATGWKSELIKDALDAIKMPSVEKTSGSVSIIEVPEYERGPLQTFVTATGMVHGSTNILNPVDLIISMNDVKAIISAHPKHDQYAVTLAIDYDSNRGSEVSLGSDGQILAINQEIRKGSKKAKSALLLTFSSGVIELCKNELDRGESRIFPVLNNMIQVRDHKVHGYSVTGIWYDVDTIHDVLSANKHLLGSVIKQKPDSVYIPDGDTMQIEDFLSLDSGIRIGRGVLLKGPCLIEKNSSIGDKCIIGPYVSMAEDTIIGDNSEVQNTVIFGSSNVPINSRIDGTIIYQSNYYREEA